MNKKEKKELIEEFEKSERKMKANGGLITTEIEPVEANFVTHFWDWIFQEDK